MTTRLPVVGSTAAQTAFCAAEVKNPFDPGRSLWIDGNQKITAGCGTYEEPQPNAFSLVQIEDCPGSTPTCRKSCYVHGLESAAKTTHDLYRSNSRTIREILGTQNAVYWAERLAEWIADNCEDFRWHVSGDIFSEDYAQFIRRVVIGSPGTDHWIYTRSFALATPLVGIYNLSLNFSVDRDNYELGREMRAFYGDQPRLCYLVDESGEVPDDLPEDSVLFPDYALRGARNSTPRDIREGSLWYKSLPSRYRRMVCPVDFYGKSESRRCGPCSKCMVPQ